MRNIFQACGGMSVSQSLTKVAGQTDTETDFQKQVLGYDMSKGEAFSLYSSLPMLLPSEGRREPLDP